MRIRSEFLALITLVALAPAAFGQGAGQQAPVASAAMPVVLELFTSQGCSSCPAADALLKTYAERPDVIALSLSVDYWDHLGWKDTLASPKHALRQRAYAKALGTGNVYTPQVVIDGAAETIGSNKALIEKAIGRTSAARKSAVALVAKNDGKRVKIEIAGETSQPGGEATAASGTIWLAIVSPQVDEKIKHGENRGRKLSYYNVVRELTAVGMWAGKPMTIELPADSLMEAGNRCAVLLQSGEGGRIVGATWMSQ